VFARNITVPGGEFGARFGLSGGFGPCKFGVPARIDERVVDLLWFNPGYDLGLFYGRGGCHCDFFSLFYGTGAWYGGAKLMILE
jgi:hypothetical protein